MLDGRKLQYIRHLKGMTQQYIADCAGISKRWVGKIENEDATPSEEVYKKWIKAFYGQITPSLKEKSK